MKIEQQLSDQAILEEMGQRITQRRLELQLTQAEVAEQAGVGKRTLERIESGASAQMLSIIRLLRVLDLLPGLEQLIPVAGPRPMDLLKRKGKLRQRASKRQAESRVEEPWSWDDDT